MLRTTIVISALVLVLFAAQGSTRAMHYGRFPRIKGMPQDVFEQRNGRFPREAVDESASLSPGSEPSIVERDDNIDIDDMVASNPFDDSSKSGQPQ